MTDHHSTTRVPVDDQYAALLGKAVYVFAYYEWNIIWIMELLDNGFVHKYSRMDSMTSGKVEKEFLKLIDDRARIFTKVSKSDLQVCHQKFQSLILKRNALIHAHPITDVDGSQILNFQTKPSKPIPDMKWSKNEVKEVIEEFDRAAVSAGEVLEKLRN